MKRVAITVAILGMLILVGPMVKVIFTPWDKLTAALLVFVSVFYQKLTKFVLDYMDKEKALKSPAFPKEIPVQKSKPREPRKANAVSDGRA